MFLKEKKKKLLVYELQQSVVLPGVTGGVGHQLSEYLRTAHFERITKKYGHENVQMKVAFPNCDVKQHL